jgi:hypothetical protein
MVKGCLEAAEGAGRGFKIFDRGEGMLFGIIVGDRDVDVFGEGLDEADGPLK